nr:glycosyltransferase family 2 protein [Lacipirellula parvula]
MPFDSTTSGSACGSIELSVIVPVYNEEATLGVVLKELLSLPIERLEVIVVDDGSTDRTPSIIAEAARADQRIRMIRLNANAGKTAAVRRGVEAVQGDAIIIQDADLEYDASEITRLIEPIFNGSADIVYGSRLLGRPTRGSWPFWHYWGNRVVTALSNCFMHWKLTDVETCYKAFRAPILKELSLTSKRFGMEIEITAMASRTKGRFLELPISYAPRDVSEGKKIRFTDGLWAIYYILRYNLLAVWSRHSRQYVQSVDRELDDSLPEPRWETSNGSAAIAGRSSDAPTTTPASI